MAQQISWDSQGKLTASGALATVDINPVVTEVISLTALAIDQGQADRDLTARRLLEVTLCEQLEAQMHALEFADGRGRGFEFR